MLIGSITGSSLQLGLQGKQVLCVPAELAVIDALAGMVDARVPGEQKLQRWLVPHAGISGSWLCRKALQQWWGADRQAGLLCPQLERKGGVGW